MALNLRQSWIGANESWKPQDHYYTPTKCLVKSSLTIRWKANHMLTKAIYSIRRNSTICAESMSCQQNPKGMMNSRRNQLASLRVKTKKHEFLLREALCLWPAISADWESGNLKTFRFKKANTQLKQLKEVSANSSFSNKYDWSTTTQKLWACWQR